MELFDKNLIPDWLYETDNLKAKLEAKGYDEKVELYITRETPKALGIGAKENEVIFWLAKSLIKK